MRRNLVTVIALAAAIVIGVGVVAVTTKHREWTTSSPEALAEFQKGLDARDKVYYAEARAAFTKAVELDPNFIMAKYFLWTTKDSGDGDPTSTKVPDELRRADLSKLTDRERFLVQLSLAAHGTADLRAAEGILSAYAEKHPDDPYLLERQASVASARQDWPEAHRLLARLIEVAPNRVVAYNQLGYLEMGQGRFDEARKNFETYRYIAPDQANPHDSLGELFILIGRYAEARTELEAALRIKPDFCASYEHLVRLSLLEGNADGAEAVLARAGRSELCNSMSGKGLRCLIAIWKPLAAGDWEGVWKAQQAACPTSKATEDPLEVWVDLRSGRRTDADALEARLRGRLEKMAPDAAGRSYVEAEVAHVEGARLLLDGEFAKAAERFRFTDRFISYRELQMGLAKLVNRVALVQALQGAGARDEAAAVLAEARAVNAGYVDLITRISAPRAVK